MFTIILFIISLCKISTTESKLVIPRFWQKLRFPADELTQYTVTKLITINVHKCLRLRNLSGGIAGEVLVMHFVHVNSLLSSTVSLCSRVKCTGLNGWSNLPANPHHHAQVNCALRSQKGGQMCRVHITGQKNMLQSLFSGPFVCSLPWKNKFTGNAQKLWVVCNR